MPNKKPDSTERGKLITQVENAERRGHYDTAHHDMLKTLLEEK